jgi:hypothetical protein
MNTTKLKGKPMKTLAILLALVSFSATAVDVVYKAETDLSVLRTEIKYKNDGSAWIDLTLEDPGPEGGVPYQTVEHITVPNMTYDVSNGDVLYKGIVCASKRSLIGAIAWGSAKLNPNCALTSKIVYKTAYVVDTEGNQHPISTTRFVEVRFGSN